MAVAAPALLAGGAIVSGVTSALNYMGERRAASRNAAALRAQALATRQQTNVNEAATRRRSREVLSAATTAALENGIAQGGTFADVYAQSAAEAELDAMNVRYQGEMEALGLQSSAANQASTARTAGTGAALSLVGGFLGAGARLMGKQTPAGYGQQPAMAA